MNLETRLSEKISSKKAKVGIIGLGYVGKSLADLTTEMGYSTIGFVTRQERAEGVNKERNKLLFATTDAKLLEKCDVILMCVQTPIYEDKQPDLRALINASRSTAKHLQKGQLIVIESSIATGTTRNIVLPILKESGLKEGTDFFLGYSPERVDPGNKKYSVHKIPKVVSGLDVPSLNLTTLFYRQIMKKVVPVSSIETAELTKMFENTFRFINISLVNEMKDYADSWGVDMWEIVNAAATKPFGFLAHFPSPGAGGHCIPVDPFYIYDDAKKRGIQLQMIQTAGRINDKQPVKVVKRAFHILNDQMKAPAAGTSPVSLIGEKGGMSSLKRNGRGKRALLIGVSYKPDINDIRESPALKIWDMLEDSGYEVWYHDPFVATIRNSQSKALDASVIEQCGIMIIVTNHSNIDYTKLSSFGVPILDTRNVYANGLRKQHIYRL